MREANVLCWIETQRKMKWRLTTRIASHPDPRWTKKAATWNPGLSIGAKANRAVGRPRKRWEDDINHFLKSEETEAPNQRHVDLGSERPKWKEMENDYVKR